MLSETHNTLKNFTILSVLRHIHNLLMYDINHSMSKLGRVRGLANGGLPYEYLQNEFN